MNYLGPVFIWSLLQFAIGEKIDVKELRCLVCKATLDELTIAIKNIDPSKTVDVGGHRLDPAGNVKQKAVSQAKSEVHLSELADSVCERMEDYIRGHWKDTGELTIIPLIINGKMNSDMSKIDVVQDDDLNKSLKFYCEGIIEEYEDNIIKHVINNTEDLKTQICTREASLCEENEDEVQHIPDEL